MHLKIEYFSEIFMQICRYQISNFAEISQKWYALSFNDAKVPFFAENSEILLQNMYMDKKFWTFEIGKISEISAKTGTFTSLKLQNYTILGSPAKIWQ